MTRLRARQVVRFAAVGCIFVLSSVTTPSVGARPSSFYSVGTKSCFIVDKGTGREVDRPTLIKFRG